MSQNQACLILWPSCSRLHVVQMAELFDVQRQAITKHIKNIFETNELEERTTSSILELVQKEGRRSVKRTVSLYNLDMIISVGFRVNTSRFVIVDDVVYHVGASFKDLGNQMTAFSVLNFVTKEQVLAMVKCTHPRLRSPTTRPNRTYKKSPESSGSGHQKTLSDAEKGYATSGRASPKSRSPAHSANASNQPVWNLELRSFRVPS